VTVAKEIELKDPYEDMGAQIAEGGRLEDLGRRGRRHDHRDRARAGDLSEGLRNVSAGNRWGSNGDRGGGRRGDPELKKVSKSTKDKKEIAQSRTVRSKQIERSAT